VTRPKRRRDGSGRFLPRQYPLRAEQRREPRPDVPRPDDPASGRLAQMPRETSACLECGTDHEELMVAVRGGRIKIVHCPRCIPDPLERIRGE
jgi:hypothetical protein